jgi:molecular chaperone GrpE (heat shock protein)
MMLFYFKEQLRSANDDHHRAVELLQSQIDSLDRENLRLQRDLQNMQKNATSPRQNEKDKSVTPTPPEFVPDFRHIERQEGEGSEIVDPEPCPRVSY